MMTFVSCHTEMEFDSNKKAKLILNRRNTEWQFKFKLSEFWPITLMYFNKHDIQFILKKIVIIQMECTSCFVDAPWVRHQTEEEDETSSRLSSDEPESLKKWTQTAGSLTAKLFWGTGRNPESQTAVIKYISHGKVLFENRMNIVHILMTYIAQCKYCLWEVCFSAEVNMELALGCTLFINVGVRALIRPRWFLRAQGRHVMGRVWLIPFRQVCDLSYKLRSQDRLSSAGSRVVVWRSLFLCGRIWSFNYFKVSHPKLSMTSWNMF